MRGTNVLCYLLAFVVLLAVLPAARAESPLLKWMRTMKAIGAVWRDVYHPGSVDASEFSPESAPKPVPVSDLSKRWKRYEPPSSEFLRDENEADELLEPTSRKRQSGAISCGTGYATNQTQQVSYCNTTCAIRQLSCSGTVLSATDVTPALFPSCVVTQVACGSTPLNFSAAVSCAPYQMLCGNVTVPASPSNLGCTLARLLCTRQSPGTIIMRLNTNTTALDFRPLTPAQPRCTVDNLFCGGLPVTNVGSAPGTPANCTIRTTTCVPGLQNCSVVLWRCQNNGTACRYERWPCEDACTVGVTTSTCYCPMDRSGPSCSNQRRFVCNWQLLSPVPQCELPVGVGPADLYDADPVCFRPALKAHIDWVYGLRCAFPDGPVNGYVEDPRFVYYARVNNTFALSGQDRRIEAILKVFNFNILSDRNASTILRLTPAQLQGDQNVTFPMDIGAIADKYFAGGRLYFEVSIYPERAPVPGLVRTWDRRFIDPNNAPRVKLTTPGLRFITVLGWLVLAVVLLVILLFALYRCCKARIKHIRKQLKKKTR